MEKILLVDDEQTIRELCTRILLSEGYEVDAAVDGRRALDFCQGTSYDLVITDIRMPDMDGFSLLDAIHEIQPDVPTVVMTGYATMEYALGAIRRGVHAFVMKPFGRGEFLAAVADAFKKHRTGRVQAKLRLLLPLFELSQMLLSERDLTRLLQMIVSTAVNETHADTASVMLIDQATRELRIQAAQGLSENIVRTARRALGERIAGWVAQTGEPLYLQDAIEHDPALRAVMTRADVAEALCIPLMYKKQVIGVLNLNKAPGTVSFNESDIELSSILAGQAAIAIANVGLFEEVCRKTRDLEEANFDTIKALAEALESKDAYTRGHSDRAVAYAVAVAGKLNLGPEQTERLKYAAILHDIGKIGIPDAILNKPGSLTQEEYEVMKTHPERGAEIVRQIKFLSLVTPLVLHHQERFDGLGYPKGLSGDGVPIESRIVSVLDAFDAMTSNRVYRKAPGKEYAVAELRRCAGSQFDPKVVEAFLQVLSEEEGSAPERR